MKRNLVYFLGLVMLISFSACSSDEDNDDSEVNEPKELVIEPAAATIIVGKENTIPIVVASGNGDYKFDFSEKDIVTASHNTADNTITVKANDIELAYGEKKEVTIIVTDSKAKKANIKITVVAEEIALKSIAVSKTKLTMTEGDTNVSLDELKQVLIFNPTDATNTKVRFTSDKENIVQVDENTGTLSAITVGVAKINVTPVDQTGGAKTVVFEVEVEALIVETAVIKVSKTAVSLALEDGDKTLEALGQIVNLEPTNVNNVFTYTSNDQTIVTVDNYGKLTPIADGMTKITVSSSIEDVEAVSFDVTVTKKQVMPSEGYIYYGDSHTFPVDEAAIKEFNKTRELTFTITPMKEYNILAFPKGIYELESVISINSERWTGIYHWEVLTIDGVEYNVGSMYTTLPMEIDAYVTFNKI